MTLKGKTCRTWANGRNIYDCEIKIDLRGSSVSTLGPYVYMYMIIIVKQVYWYISQISGERLQDHWPSG